jgi:hypothetical protein
MYRKLRRRERSTGLDLDSLMDILSCLVGVMLFLVIYAVLELGSMAYEAEIPIVTRELADSGRVVVVAGGGTVRILDVASARSRLLSGFEIVESFEEVQVFLDANRATPTDAHFVYSLQFVERLSTDLVGTLDLVVEEQAGAAGETVADLDERSRFVAALGRLDADLSWLSFAVDSASVDVFRRARELAITRGFATRWDQVNLEFPLVLSMSTSAPDWLEERTTSTKPLR